MFSLEQIDPRFSPRELGTYSDNIRFAPIFLGFFVNFSERVGETQEFAEPLTDRHDACHIVGVIYNPEAAEKIAGLTPQSLREKLN